MSTVRMSTVGMTTVGMSSALMSSITRWLAGVHPNCALHAMYAHRLWIRLWMSLGQQRENSGHPGGNAGVTGTRRVALHSLAAAAPRPATAAVHDHSRSCLRGRRISPGSTDPMTTTFLHFQRDTHCKKARRPRRRGDLDLTRTGGDR
jgi:hypothetical protein